MKPIYIAAPVVGITETKREQINAVAMAAARHLGERDFCGTCYMPWKLKVPNAWNMPMNEWARCVFSFDVQALDEAVMVVVCDYGRESTAGTAWEAGYAFAKNKDVIVVQMPDVTEVSLMVRNGCKVVVPYEKFITDDWQIPDYHRVNQVTQN